MNDETTNTPPQAPKLLDQLRERIRLKHYSIRTEQSYVHWTKRYLYFHKMRYPAVMGKVEIEAFLTSLAVEGKVSASTQTQALSALLFLERHWGQTTVLLCGWIVLRPFRAGRVPMTAVVGSSFAWANDQAVCLPTCHIPDDPGAGDELAVTI